MRKNRPHWNVLEGDIKNFDFSEYQNQIDVVTGGFPCQAFSYAGKKLGLNDARGTLFYEFARVVNEVKPAICIGENVRGLLSHENGKTLEGMMSTIWLYHPRLVSLFHHCELLRLSRAIL